MTFAHDTRVALEGTAAFVNTALEPDAITTPQRLAAHLQAWQWTGVRTGEDRELRAVRALRPRLRELWTCTDDRRVELVNQLLRQARALPQLVRHGHWSWHLHATPSDAPLATRMAVEAAMAMVDLIRSDDADRLRLCAAVGADGVPCGGVLVDQSKNRSRKYCSTACGNRMAAAAYRARRG